jgi:hypothetical protein
MAFLDWVWRKPVMCRLSHEHVPHPDDVASASATCLRCAKVYDDGLAQIHRGRISAYALHQH